ncbi:hypothetical protein GW17_00058393, partial [Ensete ventricosum]
MFSNCTAWYGWYVSVRPLIGTWTAHYRVIPPIRVKKREKKRENLEIQHCSPNLDPLPVGFSVLRRENLQRSRGEGPMRRLLIEASQGDFFSLRRLLEEKTFLLPITMPQENEATPHSPVRGDEASPRPARGEEASPRPARGRSRRLVQRGETRRCLIPMLGDSGFDGTA